MEAFTDFWHLFTEHPVAFLAVSAFLILFRKYIFLVLQMLSQLPPVALILVLGLFFLSMAAVRLFLQDATFRTQVLALGAVIGSWLLFFIFDGFSHLGADALTDGGRRLRLLRGIAAVVAVVASIWAFHALAPWNQDPRPVQSIGDVDFTFMCGRWADREVSDADGKLIPEFRDQPKVLIWRQKGPDYLFEVYRLASGILTHYPQSRTEMEWSFTAWNHLGLDTEALRKAPEVNH